MTGPWRFPFTVIDEAVHILDSLAEPWGIEIELDLPGPAGCPPAAPTAPGPGRWRRRVSLGAEVVEMDGHHNAWMVLPGDWAGALDEAIGRVLRSNATAGAFPGR
ncbi:MAG TPA: hypothetical protein VFJ85_11690 [Acidimicrobiales bacterium]|nr:hypothetical protein [Acidimicrobiales bacterium]